MWIRLVVGTLLVNGCSATIPIEPVPPAPAKQLSRSETPERPAEQSEAAAPTDREPAAPAELEFPTVCADPEASICTPPSSFSTALCQRKSGDHALAMFGKGTPWTRAYLRGDLQAWYAGARRTAPADLKFDEEVLILENRSGASGGMVIGGGSYDVLRWDGQCVSVMADEVTLKRPPTPGVAPIVWRQLAEETRDALLGTPRIKLAAEQSRERCRDDRSAPRCLSASERLSLSIADYVRSGGDVPEPRLVMW